ncbi:MAG: hypothetical protein WBP72_19525 [Rhodocyclaceae bacterium]
MKEITAIPLEPKHWSFWAFLLATFAVASGTVWVASQYRADSPPWLLLLGIVLSFGFSLGAAARAREVRLKREEIYAAYLAILDVPTLIRASVSPALSEKSKRAVVEYLNRHHPGALAE